MGKFYVKVYWDTGGHDEEIIYARGPVNLCRDISFVSLLHCRAAVVVRVVIDYLGDGNITENKM